MCATQRSGRVGRLTTVLILPTREILTKVMMETTARRGISFDPKSLVEYVLLAWIKSGDELWLSRRIREGYPSSYIDYIRTYISDDLFEGDEFSALGAFEIFLEVESDFYFIFDRLKIESGNVILSEPKWFGGDVAIKVFD